MLERDTLDYLRSFIESANVKSAVISPNFFQSFTGCLDGACGGCCKKVSLLYDQSSNRWKSLMENHPLIADDFQLRIINNHSFMENKQKDNKTDRCKYLDERGLCFIHTCKPLACTLPMMKFINKKTGPVFLSSIYSRRHAFRRMDGQRGALCKIIPYLKEDTQQKLANLRELIEFLQAAGENVESIKKLVNLVFEAWEDKEIRNISPRVIRIWEKV